MDVAPVVLRKSYSAPYVLDRGKFSRMLSIIEQRFVESGQQFVPGYEVQLKNGKSLLLRSGQEVLALDNAVKNPITQLDINVPGGDQEMSNASPNIHLHFDSDRVLNIAVSVASPNGKLATELFAELEEQIDRTLVSNWITRFVKSRHFPLFLIAGVSLSALISTLHSAGSRDGGKARPEDLTAIERMLTTAQTESAKVDALVQVKLRETRAALPPPEREKMNWRAMLTWRSVFIALPALVLLGTLGYMVGACYPWTVFAWGDYEQHYGALVARRKTLGTVVVAALILGVMTNLFVASIPLLR